MNCVDFIFEKKANYEKNLIIGTHETVTYQTVFLSIVKLAMFIQDKIGIGEKVILIGQNSTFYIIAYFAIIKSGNICVPLNPSIEQSNLDYILSKSQAKLGFISLLVQKQLRISIEKYSEADYLSLLPANRQSLNTEKDFDQDQIAEIIYTSGSTSTPKGVMLTHKNIISNTESIISYLKLNEDDVMQVVLPFYYCYGLSLLHTHIRVGAQLLLNNNFIFLGSTINNFNKYNCTGFAGVPSHYQILLRKTELFKNSIFTNLRYVTQAGGKLHESFIKEFNEAFPLVPFFVMYGQTEATARLSYLPPEMLNRKSGSIGKGIPGVELRVIDSQGKDVKPGNIGEIVAHGDNVMAGYFDDIDETAKTIRDGWLYTGDLGTWDEDGYIYLTARKKEIIKVGGKRVSPKEIEDVIYLIPGIIDCTIEGIDDQILGEAIMATIVVNEIGKEITSDFIKAFCNSKLVGYKVPTVVIFKDSLEINSTGKKTKIHKNNPYENK